MRKTIAVMSDMIGDGTPGANPFRPRLFDSHIPGEDMSYSRGDAGLVVCQVDVTNANKFDGDSHYFVVNIDDEGESVEADKPISLAKTQNIIAYLATNGFTPSSVANRLGVQVSELQSALNGKKITYIIQLMQAITDTTKPLPDETLLIQTSVSNQSTLKKGRS